MTQYMNRKYRNKCSLHVADHLRGEIVHSEIPRKPRGVEVAAQRYQCLGFMFTRGERVDPQEYTDFWHMQWYRIELDSDLKLGVLPSGLLIRCPGGEVCVVRNSDLVPLDGQFEVVEEKGGG
jgi:hypothetical protein